MKKKGVNIFALWEKAAEAKGKGKKTLHIHTKCSFC